MATVDIGGANIGYDLEGEGAASKPWLVLLHEIGGTRETWAPVAQALARRFKVLRYDQRGAGESSRISDPFTMDTQIDDLSKLLGPLALGVWTTVVGLAFSIFLSASFGIRLPAWIDAADKNLEAWDARRRAAGPAVGSATAEPAE